MYTWLLPIRFQNAPRNRSFEININFTSQRFYAYVVIDKKKKKESFGETGHVNSRAQASLASCSFSVATTYKTSLCSLNWVLTMSFPPSLICTASTPQHNTHLQEHYLNLIRSRLVPTPWKSYKIANMIEWISKGDYWGWELGGSVGMQKKHLLSNFHASLSYCFTNRM